MTLDKVKVKNSEDKPCKVTFAVTILPELIKEKNIEVVNNYFSMLRERKTKLFYCCNRLEKTFFDGRVTRFNEYAWKKEDKHLVDEKCPWHQFFFARSTNPNLKLFNLIPIPLLHRYDGVHWHRLSLLSH